MPYGLIAKGKLSTGDVSVPEKLARTAPNDFGSSRPHGIRIPNGDTRPSRDAFSHSKSEGRRPPRHAQYAAASCHDTPVTGWLPRPAGGAPFTQSRGAGSPVLSTNRSGVTVSPPTDHSAAFRYPPARTNSANRSFDTSKRSSANGARSAAWPRPMS